MHITISRKTFILYILLFVLYIDAFWSVKGLQYYDELLGLLALCYIALNLIVGVKREKFVNDTFFMLLGTVIIGLLANAIFRVQNNILDVFIDLYTFVKPYAIFLACYILLKKKNVASSFVELWIPTIRFLSYIIIICLFIGFIFDTQLAYYDKWALVKSIKTYVFFSKYPSVLAVNMSSIAAILLLDYKKPKNILSLSFLCISMIATQAGMGFISVFVLGLLLFLFNNTKKLKWYHILLMIVTGTFVGYTEVREYLINTDAARYLLLYYGIKTAIHYIPFGSGFGTYGGSVAAKSYSKLYLEYGFSTRWGMGENENGFYLNDSYFPMIFGQFGFIGTFLYGRYYFKLFKYFNNNSIKNCRIALLYIFIIMMLSNLSQGGFSSTAGIIYLINICLILNYHQNSETQNIIQDSSVSSKIISIK
jgi:hypothetical protein